MGVKTHTTYEVRCEEDGCQSRFVWSYKTKKEAELVARQHQKFHQNFEVGTKVRVPHLEAGRIATVWFDMEEAVVTLEQMGNCHQCPDHPHQYMRTWRGKLSLLTVLARNAG